MVSRSKTRQSGVAVFGLLLLITAAACARSPEEKSAKYMEKGRALLAKHENAKAILEFRNAVKLTPKNPEAYYHLGVAYVADGDIKNGIAALQVTLGLNPEHAGANLTMAQLMVGSGDQDLLKNAEDRLGKFLQAEPDNVQALHALSVAEMRLEQPGEAIAHLTHALATAPKDLVLTVTLTQAKLAAGDIKGAEEVLQHAVAASPGTAAPLVLLGDFYASQKRSGDSESAFQKALSVDPNHGPALYKLAMLESATGRKGPAENHLKQLSTAGDKTLRGAYGMFLFQEGRRDDAIHELQRLYNADPEDRAARSRVVAAYVASGQPGNAEQLLNAVLRKNAKDADALIQRASIFIMTNRVAEAEKDVGQAARFRPDSGEIHFYMAIVHGARGATQRQKDELYQAIRLNPELFQARMMLSQLLVATGGASAALEVIDGAPADQKGALPVIVQRNWALLANGHWPELKQGVTEGLKLGRSGELLYQKAVLELKERKEAEAKASLTAALQIRPDDVLSLKLLSEIYGRNPAAAATLIREHAAKFPDSQAVQLFAAEWLAEHNEGKVAREMLAKMLAADPSSPRAALLAARLDAEQGRYDAANVQLTSLVASNRGGQEARLLLAKVQGVSGNTAAAMDGYKAVLELAPDNVDALNNLAYLLCEEAKRPDEALSYAQKAVQAAPENGAVKDTLGWIYYRKGLYPMAAKLLESAVSKENVAVRQYHLAMAYFRAGDIPGGQKALRAGEQNGASLPEAREAKQVEREVLARK